MGLVVAVVVVIVVVAVVAWPALQDKGSVVADKTIRLYFFGWFPLGPLKPSFG